MDKFKTKYAGNRDGDVSFKVSYSPWPKLPASQA
jgi:hypothetical protein